MAGPFDDLVPQGASGSSPASSGAFDDLIPKGSWGGAFDDLIPKQEGAFAHIGRRFTEGNRGVARADAGAQLAAVENYDVQGAAQDFARPRLLGDVEPASSAFLTEQTGNRQRFMEQKALLGGDVNPQQARQASALDAFETARNAKGNALMAEINANSPQPTEAGQVGPVTQFVGDVAGNIPRLGRTMAAGVASAPLGGVAAPAYMAEQIFGETYAGYRQKGKDPERAAIAAGINALAQAPLEYVPTKKLLDMLGSKGGKLAGIAKVMGAEGLTEYAQAYPEAFADVYVDNPGKSAGELLSLFAAKVKTGDFQRGAAYEGAVGAVTGGGLAGVAAGVQKAAEGKQAQPQAPTGAESLQAVGDQQDAALAQRIVGPESGGNPNAKNPNSTARGLGQFTQSTRDSMLARHGVDAYSADPAEQMKALEILTRENREALTKGLGRAPTDGEIYTAHFLGSGGATQFLGALQASPEDAAVNHVSPAAARANQGVFYNKDGSAKTVAEVAAFLAGKVGQGEAVAQPKPTGDVFDQVAQQEQPEGEFGALRPELAAIREDMQARPGGVEQVQPADVDPWEVKTVQDAASQAAGVQLPRARENELRSLREDIQSREVQQRAREEQGIPAPVQQAQRIGSNLALPAGTPPPVDGGARSQMTPAIALQGQQFPALQQGQGFEAVPTPAQPDPSATPWKNLVFVAKGLGVEKPSKMTRPALVEAVRQAQAVQMRATVQAPQDMRVQFKPEARTPAQFPEADALLGGPGINLSASRRRGPLSGPSTRDVSTATAAYERAMPGAAPTRILQTAQELPAHIQEAAARQGYSLAQIRGVHDPRTGSVYLVADNLIDPAEAGRIWLHEQLAHHGLRELFGSSAKFRSVLEGVRKDYKLGSLREAEEMIAGIAEKLDAGQALSPRDGFHWRKVVDAVRSWLAEKGISVSRANLEAMLRKSARNLAKGGDTQGLGMQEAAAFSQGEERFSIRKDTDDALPKLAQASGMSSFARVFSSPEYYKHPVLKKLFNIFRSRHDRAHEILHTALDNGDGKGGTVMDDWKALGKENQRLLTEIVDIADVREIKRDAVEKWMEEKGTPEPVRAVWRTMRSKYDAMLVERLKPYEEQLKKGINPDITYVDSTGKTVTMSLREAVNEMGRMAGFYAPRQRPIGDLAVLARRKGADGEWEYARHHAEWKIQAKKIARDLKKDGWEITGFERIAKLGESTQQAIAKLGEVASVVREAAQNLKGVPDEAKQSLMTELVENLSTEIKARGFRSSAIRRTGRHGRVVRGYIEDAGERFATYVQGTAYGLAKVEASQKAVQALFETDADGKLRLDPRRNAREFEVAQKYLSEQLRNSEKADRVIGLAKSIATFKFMGFNPKSALVNLTTLATQVPAALRVYATDSKAGMTKSTAAVARAIPDAVAFMLGKKLNVNADERTFLEEIRRKDMDDPQFAREAFKTFEATSGKAWSMAMRTAMKMFGTTEQLNRLSTLLAGYRLARGAGFSHTEAVDRAQLASDRAHGVYGREALPEAAWGTNAGARAVQLMYVYQKYSHNTLQLLADVWGKKDARAFMHLLVAPLVVGGAKKAGLAATGWMAARAVMSALYDDDRDPSERFMSWVRDALGKDAEDMARFGLFGLMGVDISGSMDTQIRIPTNLVELTGAIGGVGKDLFGKQGAAHYLAAGQPDKALEKVLPTGMAAPLKAMREGAQGITDTKGNRMLDEQGKPYMPTPEEVTAKSLGFRPAREARVRDMRSAAIAEERTFQDRRTSIFEAYRAYANGGRNPEALASVVEKVQKFNADVDKMDRPNISPITQRSLESQLVRMESPSRKELGRLGIGEADEVPELTEKQFAQAEARAAFKVEAKQINAARDAYNEAQKAGRKDEAARIARESDLVRLSPMVKAASARLSQITAAKNKLEDNPKLDAATRKRWLDKLDEQEAAVLNAFQKQKGARRG